MGAILLILSMIFSSTTDSDLKAVEKKIKEPIKVVRVNNTITDDLNGLIR